VLHKRNYAIAEPTQVTGLSAITPPIIGDFLAPPLTISFRLGIAAMTPVPETAMNEDGDFVMG
jgi:hypothetical protein